MGAVGKWNSVKKEVHANKAERDPSTAWLKVEESALHAKWRSEV
jgi:hypothetical protein